MPAETAAKPAATANDLAPPPREKDEILIPLRDVLYPLAPARDQVVSTQCGWRRIVSMRRSFWSGRRWGRPVMTYSLLKGEDMRLSSRMIAVVGTLLAVNNSPFGDSVRAMAGGIVNSPLGHSVRAITGV